ncbi:hypothetical protein ACFE04_026354 [Oxalis oulophora]
MLVRQQKYSFFGVRRECERSNWWRNSPPSEKKTTPPLNLRPQYSRWTDQKENIQVNKSILGTPPTLLSKSILDLGRPYRINPDNSIKEKNDQITTTTTTTTTTISEVVSKYIVKKTEPSFEEVKKAVTTTAYIIPRLRTQENRTSTTSSNNNKIFDSSKFYAGASFDNRSPHPSSLPIPYYLCSPHPSSLPMPYYICSPHPSSLPMPSAAFLLKQKLENIDDADSAEVIEIVSPAASELPMPTSFSSNKVSFLREKSINVRVVYPLKKTKTKTKPYKWGFCIIVIEDKATKSRMIVVVLWDQHNPSDVRFVVFVFVNLMFY